MFSQPQRGCVLSRRPVRRNPVGVDPFYRRIPRVARASQPWADGCSPVGAEEGRAFPSAESRTLATLRDTLLPKLLSGELSEAESTARMPAEI